MFFSRSVHPCSPTSCTINLQILRQKVSDEDASKVAPGQGFSHVCKRHQLKLLLRRSQITPALKQVTHRQVWTCLNHRQKLNEGNQQHVKCKDFKHVLKYQQKRSELQESAHLRPERVASSSSATSASTARGPRGMWAFKCIVTDL